MTAAFILLAHDRLDRVGALAEALAQGGRPVALHLDAATGGREAEALLARAREAGAILVKRRPTPWGGFGLVSACLDALRALCTEGGAVSHVMLVSGADAPLRPLGELDGFLAGVVGRDFIESAPLDGAAWVKGGLGIERFTLRHPFNWRTQRGLFDASVTIQRRLKLRRRLPRGLAAHLGAQWWCLSRETVEMLLADPRLPEWERWFPGVWIPDESFFQTVLRALPDRRIDQRPLTFARFDAGGRPHEFFDEHAPLLAQTDHFFARKIAPEADWLHAQLLARAHGPVGSTVFEGRGPDAALRRAARRRDTARPGALHIGRFPVRRGDARFATPDPYLVLSGGGVTLWAALAKELRADMAMAGRIYGEAPDFGAGPGAGPGPGATPHSAGLRDDAPDQMLINLIRGARPRRFGFILPTKDIYGIMDFVAGDANARVVHLARAWAPALWRDLGRPDRADGDAIAAARLAAQADRDFEGRLRAGLAASLSVDLAVARADTGALGRAIATLMGGAPPRASLALAPVAPGFLADLRTAGLDLGEGPGSLTSLS